MNVRSSGDHLENPRMSPEFSREQADSAEYDDDLDDFQDASRNRHTRNVEITLISFENRLEIAFNSISSPTVNEPDINSPK